MLLTYYGSPCTPLKVQEELSEMRGFRTDSSRNLINWPNLPAVYPQIQSVKRSDFNTRDPNPAEIAALHSELALGKPSILKVDGIPGTDKLDEHFVLATSSLESGIIVADPYSGQFKPLTDFCPTSKPWRKSDAAAIWSIISFQMKLK